MRARDLVSRTVFSMVVKWLLLRRSFDAKFVIRENENNFEIHKNCPHINFYLYINFSVQNLDKISPSPTFLVLCRPFLNILGFYAPPQIFFFFFPNHNCFQIKICSSPPNMTNQALHQISLVSVLCFSVGDNSFTVGDCESGF